MSETISTKAGNAGRISPAKVLVQAAIPALVGGFFFWKHRPLGGGILVAIGLVVLVSGFFIPSLFRRIDHFGQSVGKAVAACLTWAVLVPLYFLVFTPGSFLLKARGIDPMRREFPGREKTYWVPRKPVAGPEEYRRQF